MQRTVETSSLLRERVSQVPGKIATMTEAVARKDFEAVAELAMRDSNQFHAVCLDTFPPLSYLNDSSHAIIRSVHALNKCAGRTVAGYTFDAGPNAVLLVRDRDIPLLFSSLSWLIPSSAWPEISSQAQFITPASTPALQLLHQCTPEQRVTVSKVFVAKIGCGPVKVIE